MKAIPFIITAALTLSAVMLSACTEHDHDHDMSVASATKLSLVQAVAVAQTHSDGLVTEAKLKRKHGTPVYEIEVADAKTGVVNEVTVDGITGKILSVDRDED